MKWQIWLGATAVIGSLACSEEPQSQTISSNSSPNSSTGQLPAMPNLTGRSEANAPLLNSADLAPQKEFENIRLEPQNPTLIHEVVSETGGEVGNETEAPDNEDAPNPGANASFRVVGVSASGAELDISERFRFWVSDNAGLGKFEDNGPVFEAQRSDARGGVLTVSAIGFIDDQELTVSTEVTLQLRATLPDPRRLNASDAERNLLSLPDFSGDLFSVPVPGVGTPEILYPANGSLLPPNLSRLEVHWMPASEAATSPDDIYRIAFESSTVLLQYIVRCGTPRAEGCGFELDAEGYRYLAESTRGQEPVQLTVQSANATEASPISPATALQFSGDDVAGAVYYWTTSNGSSIVRFDFGQAQTEPETFIQSGRGELPQGDCVGCHALSRDGSKLVASLNGRGNGQQILVTDLSSQQTDPGFFDVAGDTDNRLQFASWNPDGSRFVAVWGDHSFSEFEGDQGDPSLDNVLWMHDGNTGQRIEAESIELNFEPGHPDWSLDGSMIAFTHTGDEQGQGDSDVSGIDRSSQHPFESGIDLIKADAGGDWAPPVSIVPIVQGLNQFNPSFVPDSSFFVYTTSTCSEPGSLGTECDGDDDPTAKSWAALPQASSPLVELLRSAQPGPLDTNTELHDTFPRSSPFAGSYQGGRVFWITISSRRRTGLDNSEGNQQLWMFAVDPNKILAGEDGSFPAFFLPFQNRTTNNHIAQWTARIVNGEPAPVQPPPAPPIVPPAPPPILR